MVIGGQKSYIFGRKRLYFNKKMILFFVENGYIFGWFYTLSVIFVSVIFFGGYIISVLFSPPITNFTKILIFFIILFGVKQLNNLWKKTF